MRTLEIKAFQRKLSLSEVYTSLQDELELSRGPELKVSPFSSNRGSDPRSVGMETVGASLVADISVTFRKRKTDQSQTDSHTHGI